MLNIINYLFKLFKPVARIDLNQSGESVVTELNDKTTKLKLDEFIIQACELSGSDRLSYPAKLMGRIKRYESMKSGYYVQIQNFDDIYEAKKSTEEKYFRYTFRCILFRDWNDYLLEVSKWTPACGSVDDDKVIFRSDEKVVGTYLERMVTAMNMVKFEM